MKKSFLNCEKPILTCMVQADNPDRIRELVEKSIGGGADAFGMQFCRLKPEYRTREVYRELFALTEGRPVYATNYRVAENEDKSEDRLAEELLELAECGAVLCDVPADLFDRPEGEATIICEPTMKREAVEKQIRLIDDLHARGAEVIMSSHLGKFIPAERVLEIALEHKRRGADITKIVTGASDMNEQIENMRIVNILRENLDIPFLFLSGGECFISRRLSDVLGNCMSLCVYEYDEFATTFQPLISDILKVRELFSMSKERLV